MAAADDAPPTILEWGVVGPAAFRRWLDVFYDLIEQEPTIAPLFGGTVTEQHRAHAAAWWVEVMGGPAYYTAQHGGYAHMLVPAPRAGDHAGAAAAVRPRCSARPPTTPGCPTTRSSAPRSSATRNGAAAWPCTTPSPAPKL